MKKKQAISEVREIRAQKEAGKAKAMLDETLGTFDENEDEEEKLPRKRPRTIGLKKALAREREKEIELAEQLTPSELLAIEIRKYRESLLEREKFHLESQLEKAKRDTNMQRKMEKHYAMRNRIARAKLKRAHAKI